MRRVCLSRDTGPAFMLREDILYIQYALHEQLIHAGEHLRNEAQCFRDSVSPILDGQQFHLQHLTTYRPLLSSAMLISSRSR